MRKCIRLLSLILAAFMVFALLAACGQKSETSTGTVSTVDDQQTTKQEATAKPSEPVKLKFTSQIKATSPDCANLIKMAKEKLNVDLEFVDLGEKDYQDKLAINVLTGSSDIDLFYEVAPRFTKYVNSDVVIALDELAKQQGVDLAGKFGNNIVKFNDKVYLLPNVKDVWMTLYNKKIFDDAGVPYPTAEGWTWSKYIETAKKLTNTEKGIWGSSMSIDWDSYKYMTAHQKGIADYKADGTSNFDDPNFAEALKFLKDLSDVDKVQPDLLTYMSKKIPYDAFTSGKYAMSVNGGWTSTFVSDKKTYPRDWKYGILPMPYPDGGAPTSLSVIGGYAVTKNSKNPEMAFKVAEYFAENEFSFNPKRQPTRVDLSKDDLTKYVTDNFIKGFEDDGVTADDYINAWFSPNAKLVNEKVFGKGDAVINKLFIDEGQLYMLGKKSLEDTMKTIKEKADKAIADDSKK